MVESDGQHKKHAELKGEGHLSIFRLPLKFLVFLKVMSNEKNTGLENLQTSDFMFSDHRTGRFFYTDPCSVS